jgi:hypothetical protein
MLAVMLPVVGLLAFRQLTILSGVIIVLLFILMLSYRQTIDSYPMAGALTRSLKKISAQRLVSLPVQHWPSTIL